jgi:hypothetical protein
MYDCDGTRAFIVYIWRASAKKAKDELDTKSSFDKSTMQ